MADCIQLRGIKIHAFCGVLEQEQKQRQVFEIDMDIEADQRQASKSDDLNYTVDYGPLCDCILNIADSHRFNLLESMAQFIVDELFSIDEKIDAISITLKKLHPPIDVEIASTAVSIYRKRPVVGPAGLEPATERL